MALYHNGKIEDDGKFESHREKMRHHASFWKRFSRFHECICKKGGHRVWWTNERECIFHVAAGATAPVEGSLVEQEIQKLKAQVKKRAERQTTPDDIRKAIERLKVVYEARWGKLGTESQPEANKRDYKVLQYADDDIYGEDLGGVIEEEAP